MLYFKTPRAVTDSSDAWGVGRIISSPTKDQYYTILGSFINNQIPFKNVGVIHE